MSKKSRLRRWWPIGAVGSVVVVAASVGFGLRAAEDRQAQRERGKGELIQHAHAQFTAIAKAADEWSLDEAQQSLRALSRHVEESPFADVELYSSLTAKLALAQQQLSDRAAEHAAHLRAGLIVFERGMIRPIERDRILETRRAEAEAEAEKERLRKEEAHRRAERELRQELGEFTKRYEERAAEATGMSKPDLASLVDKMEAIYAECDQHSSVSPSLIKEIALRHGLRMTDAEARRVYDVYLAFKPLKDAVDP